MNLRYLRLVQVVAEEGNLTQAGKRLFLSQSALSHQLKEFENQLGTPLFQRLNKKMILTQAGDKILATANHVLCELEKAENEIRAFTKGDSGLLRISTECYTCYHWLPRVMKSYSRQFPNVDVQIEADGTRQPEQFLLDGKLELAIVSCLKKQDDHPNLKFIKLFEDDMVVVVSQDHPFAQQETVMPHQFKDQHILCYTAPEETLDVFQRVLIPSNTTPKKVSKFQLTEAIIEMIKADIGISIMAKWAVKPYLKSKKLATVPVHGNRLRRHWYAVKINRDNTPKYIDSFIKSLIDHPMK